MTKIDFYQLTPPRNDVDAMVCHLCHKAYQHKQNTLLLTNDSEHSERLDRLLWTRHEESFIPHDREEQDGFITPILITDQADPRGERVLLINLSHEVPLFFAQFERVIELVTDDNKSIARSHYSFYKERGYLLGHHTV